MLRVIHHLITVVLFLGLWSACQFDKLEDPVPIVIKDPIQMIHLAHTRMDTNADFIERMTQLDFSTYDLRLLGGDMAFETSKDRVIMDSLDKIFDFADAQTLWALGNHDYNDLALVEEYTQRPAYYAYTHKAITFLVLDTQDSMSNFVGQQLELINNVLDTISESTHLVLLHHKLIWMYGEPVLEAMLDSVSNGELGERFEWINANDFYDSVYPGLVEVEERGIEVLCIAGDLGRHVKSFEYQTPEGIDFIGSGMQREAEDNTVLILDYDFEDASLRWSFNFLKDL